MTTETSTQQWYEDYYRKKGADRNDLRTNRGVLFQTLASEASLVRAAAAIRHDPAAALVLDVGCGGGGDLFQLLRLGYQPENIVGIDILTERLDKAKLLYPQMRFIQGDASRMDFADDSFDLLFESGMFATLPDDALSAAIAREMVRVCKTGGYLLLVDWRTPKPSDPNYKALSRRRLAELFAVGRGVEIVKICRGALVPPLGRFLSRWLPSAYFATAAVFPFLVGQVSYVLKKQPS
ncbi:MAG: class I SAM-dependent methyltransferase [Pirellulales bacterium]|nr:class I SAM-dependent methyltransferase [Pirellulales bacterium]